jgi:heat-inducible transcriptional repressor
MLLQAAGQAAIVVTSVTTEAVIRQVHLARVAPRTLVLMVALSTGHVVHHSLAEAAPLSRPEVARCGRLLRRALVGRSLADARQALASLREQMSSLDAQTPLLGLPASLADAPHTVQQVFFEGAALIAEAPEFRHSARLPRLLSLLDRGERLARTVLGVSAGRDFAVSIGKENPASEMRQCSLVLRTLMICEEPPTRATLAVLGPTRMDYPRVAGTLRDFAAELPRWLCGR